MMVIIIFFSLFCFKTTVASDFTSRVGVEIELEPDIFAESYRLEIKKKNNENTILIKKEEKSPIFKINLEVGAYLFRTRIVGEGNELGPWSDWVELVALPKEVTDIKVSSLNKSIKKNETYADFNLTWRAPEGATGYVIWISDLEGNILKKENSLISNYDLKLSLGEFKVGIQAVSKDGLRSKVVYLENPLSVGRAKLPDIEVQNKDVHFFIWKNISGTQVKVDIYYKPFFGDNYKRIKSLKNIKSKWRFPEDLKSGEYQLDFQYLAEHFENGPIKTLFYVRKPKENEITIN